MNSLTSKGLNHIIVLIIFFIISMIYYNPLLDGKKVSAHDNINYLGSSKEIRDYREKYDAEPLWTNRVFGGMPAYQISRIYKGNIFEKIDKKILIIPKPALWLFLTMAGFYLMLLLFGVDWRISSVGAIAFAYSSYFLIIIAAGHNAKAAAIVYMAPMIGSLFYVYRKKTIPGLILFAIAFGLQLASNHVQITYYTFILLFVLVAYIFLEDLIQKNLKTFFKKSALIAIVGLIVLGTNFSNLYFTYDYGQDSQRGKSEITLQKKDKDSSGLDKNYALMWSYGLDETFTLIIPNFRGGASSDVLNEDSKTYDLLLEYYKRNPEVPQHLKKKQAIKHLSYMSGYWGKQPSTSGPVYIGAIIFFLFLLAMIVYKNPIKWWMLGITLIAIMLAWGSNFKWLSYLFLDYFPGYNKFRAVTMTLVMAQFTIPLIAFLGLGEIVKGNIPKKKVFIGLFTSFGIVGSICLFFYMFGGLIYNFESVRDTSIGSKEISEALQLDRLAMFKGDAFRSLRFVLLAAATVYFIIELKSYKKGIAIVVLAILVLVDLWVVDKRYMNNSKFVSKKESRDLIVATPADKYILNDKELNYRVINLSVSTFQDATPSYFHNSLGGYHAAKMKRYQNVIDSVLTRNISELVRASQSQKPGAFDSTLYLLNGFNMLNTKYIIASGERKPMENPYRFGPAWFVKDKKIVDNADEELFATRDGDIRNYAIIDKKFVDKIGPFGYDSSATIKISSYLPNHLTYNFKSSEDGLVVFSEIYYPKGWNAYIDGKLTDYFRADFLLRAMNIPRGDHKVEFKFEPKMYNIANNIQRVCSLLIVLLVIGGSFMELKKSKKDGEIAAEK